MLTIVDVQRQDPVGAFDQWVPVSQLERRPLNAAIVRAGISDVMQGAKGLQLVQHGVGAVIAIV